MTKNLKNSFVCAMIMMAMSGASTSCGQPSTNPEDPSGAGNQPTVPTLEQLAQRVVELERQLTLQNNYISRLEEHLNNLTSGTSSSPFASGGVFGRISKDEELLKEYGRATQGKLNIVNHRGFAADIYVNGIHWSAIPGESYIFVPVGKVTIQEGRHLSTRQARVFPITDWREQQPNGDMEMTYTIYQ